MTFSSRLRNFLSCAAFLCVAAPATATTIEPLSVPQLIRRAEGIAVGTVVDVQSVASFDGDYVYTFVTFGDVQFLKGGYSSSEYTIRLDGGTTDERVVQVHGMPDFQVDERRVIFLEGNGINVSPLLGWGQGALRVVQDRRLGQGLLENYLGAPLLGIERGQWVTGKERLSEDGRLHLAQGPKGHAGEARDAHGIVVPAADESIQTVERVSLSLLRDVVGRVMTRARDDGAADLVEDAAIRSAELFEVGNAPRGLATSPSTR